MSPLTPSTLILYSYHKLLCLTVHVASAFATVMSRVNRLPKYRGLAQKGAEGGGGEGGGREEGREEGE